MNRLAVAALLMVFATQGHAQSEAGTALGSPAKAKIAPAAVAPTVKPGFNEPSQDGHDREAMLALAIQNSDLRAAFAYGATAGDIVKILHQTNSQIAIDPATDAFVRGLKGEVMLVSGDAHRRSETWMADFAAFSPPGGIESLPTEEELFGPIDRTRPDP